MTGTGFEQNLERAREWASALDDDDFERLPGLMSPDCVYLSPQGVLTGTDDIVGSYRSSSDWAHATFDSITWGSDMELEPEGTVLITFIDITDHGGEHHVYRCKQRIGFDEDARIEHIEHIAIPSEEATLAVFLERHGITRPRASPAC